MLDNNLISTIEELVKNKKFTELKSLIPLHPEDIAHIISQISNPAFRIVVFRMISTDKAVDVFECLPFEEQEAMLKSLTSTEIQNILNEMSPDDRTEFFEEMPAELVKRFLSILSSDERKIAIGILNYPSDSVGRLITPDFVQLYEDMTVEEALEHIRKVGMDKETIYHCYVLGREATLEGVVPLKKIVLAPAKTRIKDIMFKEVIKVNVYTDKEEAANTFKKYDIISLPVVDNNDKLLGIVTFDDFVDVLEEEATEDFEKIAAVLPVEKPYMEAGFLSIVWKRSFWLILLAVLESASGFVLQAYGWMIHRWIALTFFLPVLVATGGNAGTQSSTIIIRGLATGEVSTKDFFKVIFRESLLGLSIGAILAVVGLARALFQQHNWLLSVSVGISMGLTIMLSAIVGASLPLISRRLKCDPAIMSGPLVTTVIDVGGIFIYFAIAEYLLTM